MLRLRSIQEIYLTQMNEKIMIKKLLITGGAGFIGSAVIRHIINNTNHSVFYMPRNWYLIQTKPREECVAEKNISSQGFEVYLPKFALNKKDKPLFSGYIFAHLADNINWRPLL